MPRPLRHRLFAGTELRALRGRAGLGQAQMAARLGLSVSYLSQLENDDRPVTSAVAAALRRAFPREWSLAQEDETAQRVAAIRDALADPLFAGLPPPDTLDRTIEQQPVLADRFLRLHDAYRRGEERLQMIDDAITTGGRLPWEEVRDWFHLAGNYVDRLDRAAELTAHGMGDDDSPSIEAIVAELQSAHGVEVTLSAPDGVATPLRHFDRTTRRIVIDRAQSAESRRFSLAHQLVALKLAEPIAAVAETAELRSHEARRLLSVGLANYAAGALLMPYRRFRDSARLLRHDIDRLCQRFDVSFEQACHRLSTLQRPGERGIPFFFCRVDMAGNITKRHSATRLQFARFGGACPLWGVHEAVAMPDRILVQLAEMPDKVRYVSMAKGMVKPSGSYARTPRRYAVALGCEVEHAADFVYADGLDLTGRRAATPIGVSCRLCTRTDCDQRAFPPADRAIAVDPDLREVVPYRIV